MHRNSYMKIVLMFCALFTSRGAFAVQSVFPVPTTQVNNDLWDVSKGTIVTSTSGMPTDPLNVFGKNFGAPNPADSYFNDGKPAGFSHFVDFQTTAPITIRSLNVWGGDDRSANAFGRRAFSEFRLYGWNGTAYVLLIDDPITVPYVQQSPFGGDGALNVHQDIPGGYTSDKWRAEFVQTAAFQGTQYGPRVLEMDGFGTFLDGSTGPAPAVPLPPAVLVGSITAGMIVCKKRLWR
jgi:hypothetical protein